MGAWEGLAALQKVSSRDGESLDNDLISQC